MATIICPKCGALVTLIRVGPDKTKTIYGADFRFCQEIMDRLRAGEKEIPEGECSEMHEAIQEAIRSGRV